jgi:arylsulfatase A-like enzyme
VSPPTAAAIPGRREFIGSAAAAILALATSPAAMLSQQRRPNLLFILADDLGYGDVSAYGRSDFRTPNIDRLIGEGVRFNNAYTAASTCTPTRVGFVTGRYPARYAPELQLPMGWGPAGSGRRPTYGLSPSIPTIASRLKKAGYHSALVGKWHLGFLPEFGPLRHGFDEFFGIKGGGADYFTHTGADGNPDLWEGEVPAERIGYLTDLLSARAVEYIGRSRTRPFYLSLHYNAPHWPWEGPADAHGANPEHSFREGGSPAVFGEMMRSLDDGIGSVMAALSRAELDRDTLVVFASDNGGERYSNNSPWSNGKFTLWEGGIRIPLALRWTGRLPAGGSSSQLAITMDWSATLLAAAGANADADHPLDGMDLLPFAAGERAPTERTLFWRQPQNQTPAAAAARRGKWKYLRIGDDESLFDLEADPGEKVDTSARFPEMFAQLRREWEAWDAQMVPMP